jgi:hypothetical protein
MASHRNLKEQNKSKSVMQLQVNNIIMFVGNGEFSSPEKLPE